MINRLQLNKIHRCSLSNMRTYVSVGSLFQRDRLSAYDGEVLRVRHNLFYCAMLALLVHGEIEGDISR